jgi:anti-anti-sigma factor
MSHLNIEQIDGVPVAHVKEDIDAANAAAIHQHLAEALGPDALSLIVDLSDTGYVDSAGLDMLLRLSDRLDHRRARLILVIPDTSQLKRLVMLVGLPEAITIRPSLTTALQEATEAQVQASRAVLEALDLAALRARYAGLSRTCLRPRLTLFRSGWALRRLLFALARALASWIDAGRMSLAARWLVWGLRHAKEIPGLGCPTPATSRGPPTGASNGG